MGLLTRVFLNALLSLVGGRFMWKNPLHYDDDNDTNSNLPTEQALTTTTTSSVTTTTATTTPRPFWEQVILLVSSFFDLLDLINIFLDIAFAVRLYRFENAQVYASLLVAGLILGRAVEYRGTALLFLPSGATVEWDVLWLVGNKAAGVSAVAATARDPQERVFSLLYCLIAVQTAIFLFEDFPALVTYAHWPVVNWPPEPLATLDTYNIAVTLLTLALVLALFVMGVVVTLGRLDWSRRHHQPWSQQLRHLAHVGLLVVGGALLARFTVQVAWAAYRVGFRDVGKIPSTSFLGVEICAIVPNVAERSQFCDEKVFLARVAVAWVAATLFFLFLWVAAYNVMHRNKNNNNNNSTESAGNDSAVGDSSASLSGQPKTILTSSTKRDDEALEHMETGDEDAATGGDSEVPCFWSWPPQW